MASNGGWLPLDSETPRNINVNQFLFSDQKNREDENEKGELRARTFELLHSSNQYDSLF